MPVAESRHRHRKLPFGLGGMVRQACKLTPRLEQNRDLHRPYEFDADRSGRLTRGSFDHGRGQQTVGGNPGLPRIIREIFSLALRQGPQERRAHRFVMAGLDPIASMALSKLVDQGQISLQVVQTVSQKTQRDHELAPLLLQVDVKDASKTGVQPEKSGEE